MVCRVKWFLQLLVLPCVAIDWMKAQYKWYYSLRLTTNADPITQGSVYLETMPGESDQTSIAWNTRRHNTDPVFSLGRSGRDG